MFEGRESEHCGDFRRRLYTDRESEVAGDGKPEPVIQNRAPSCLSPHLILKIRGTVELRIPFSRLSGEEKKQPLSARFSPQPEGLSVCACVLLAICDAQQKTLKPGNEIFRCTNKMHLI